MRISDIIARFIEEELEKRKGSVKLSRSELAEQFNCVPSQINYVLMTRFTPEHGYYIDSRRGGGGYIKISRIKMDKGLLIMHIINTIGDKIDSATAAAFISNMLAEEVILENEALIIAAATSDKALAAADRDIRDELRAAVLKRCLLVLA